uniref:Uncharacterized protein n=1 Tax=Tanacetum cinerariifolium TaxID=118510 RepID=A0A6L2M1Y8_TANCI|nr:hypothetical protein [Tanacetum cinerariifolium]
MKSGLVSVNTARQVNVAHPKTTVNVARSMSYLSKTAHSTVKRPIHKNTTFKNSHVNQRVNTVKGKNINTARPKAVVNVVKGNLVNAVKASACWVWKPKTKVIGYVSKYNSESITLKKFDYIDAQGRSKLVMAWFWSTAMAKTINGEAQIHAWVDGKKIINTKSYVRRDLRLADEKGVDCFPNSAIFENRELMGYEVVYKELDDRLLRAATIASSLEAEQDSGAKIPWGIPLLKLVEDNNTAKVIIDAAQVSIAGEVNVASIATTTYKRELKKNNITLIKTWEDVQAKIDVDHQLAKRMQAEEQQELTDEEKATLFMQLLEIRLKFFAVKRAKEKRNKPSTQAQQRKIIWFNRAFKRVNTFVDYRIELVKGSSKRAGEEMTQESAKKQKLDDDKETADLKQLMKIILDEEEVAIDVIPLVVKSPGIVDWKMHKEGKKSYYQIIRADGSLKMYLVFNQMLKSFHREDFGRLVQTGKS